MSAYRNVGWAVIAAREVHVVPCDSHGEPVMGHRPALDCPCQPKPQRDGPLDTPIWAHNEPSWPGANASLVT